MKNTTIRNLILILSLCFAGVACSDNATGVNKSNPATFKGKVESGSMQQTTMPAQRSSTSPAISDQSSLTPVKGAVVTAAVVTANGELKMIGNNHAKTNANGKYTLKVDLSAVGNLSNRIVIMAEKNGRTTKALVATKVKNGETVIVQPITLESSAEASVYQQVVANGDQHELNKTAIEVAVGIHVAAEIENNSQAAAELAEALIKSSKAKAKFYAKNSIQITEKQKQQIIEAKQMAAVELASKLNTASSVEARQDAFHTFLKTVASAKLNAGVKAWAVAESNDFAARVMLKNVTSLSSDVKQKIRKHAYFYTAVAVDAAAQAQAKAVGASDKTINAIASAGATLKTNIMSMTDASAKAINNAFTKFHEAVKLALKSDSSINGSALVAIDSTINKLGGLKSTLEAQLSAAADLNAMLNVYSVFYTGVKSLVKATLNNASKAEVQAYTRMLIAINLAT